MKSASAPLSFLGSVQIFKYLIENNVELTSSIWPYATHGAKRDIIELIKKEKINPDNNDFSKIYKKAIKFHQNSFAENIYENLMDDIEDDDALNNEIDNYGIHYFNFAFLPEKMDCIEVFNSLCANDYLGLVKILLEKKVIDIKNIIILMKKKINFNSVQNEIIF